MDGNGDKFLFFREVYDAILPLYGKMKAVSGHLNKEIGNNIKQKQQNFKKTSHSPSPPPETWSAPCAHFQLFLRGVPNFDFITVCDVLNKFEKVVKSYHSN